MRLINIDTMHMEEFHGSQIPEYFILSHTWDAQGEISFQDYLWLNDHDETNAQGILSEMTPKQRERTKAKAQSIKSTAGFMKIERFAGLARDARAKLKKSPTGYRVLWSANVNHIWIDTACINKESSAELSEAINSMFAWYQRAAACFAYLGDCERDADLAKGRWFTRGWTLQELLAPKEVIFFSASWAVMGTRTTFASTISAITRIQPEYLLDRDRIPTATIARRMSWASNRSTTREEDMAYCLLGIFGINMPLLYGEGGRAFIRLQEEIIRHDNDHTIFCWSWPTSQDPDSHPDWSGCLAPQPSVFAGSAHYERAHLDEGQGPHEFQLTNAGLRINAVVLDCLKETYRLIVFNAMESQPGGIQPRFVSVVVQSTFQDDIYLARPRFPNRLLALPYSHQAFGSTDARRTVYLVHQRDPNGLLSDRKRSFRTEAVLDRTRTLPTFQAVMPIFSNSLSSRLWGEARPRGLDGFAVSYGAAFAFMEDSTKHETKHLSICAEDRTPETDWDVVFTFRGLNGGDAVAVLCAIARKDAEFVIPWREGTAARVRPLLLAPEPAALAEFPRWV